MGLNRVDRRDRLDLRRPRKLGTEERRRTTRENSVNAGGARANRFVGRNSRHVASGPRHWMIFPDWPAEVAADWTPRAA